MPLQLQEIPMRNSMWTYAWDVQEQGFETVVRDLRETAGVGGVSLATSYHAGRFLKPRGTSGKVYFPEDGTIYFEPTAARWAKSRLKPKVSSVVAHSDVLRQFTEAREQTGLAVHAWTVCLHNMRLGLAHPDVCTVNAFGDINSFSLCPSHPDAREYVGALVEDLTTGYRPDSVELETPSFMPYAHGFHHEKDGVGLTAEGDFLLSLCFCPSCLDRAGRAGVDGEAAQQAVVGLATDSLERAVPKPRWPDFAARGPEALAEFPELHAYALWRSEPVTSLVGEIRDRADPASKVYVVDGVDGWVCGCDHAALARASDGLVLCTYDMGPDKVSASIARAREMAGPDKYVGAGFRAFYPEFANAGALRANAQAAIAAGADGANFYCYGLIPAARLDWVKQALA
jgi:hypothetical protein